MSILNNTPHFNPELDKITERELVYDIVSRLRIGNDMQNPDSDLSGGIGNFFDAGARLKDDILTNIIRSLNTFPAPTLGSWSLSPTKIIRVVPLTALRRG